jgi:predicted lipoprotein with Yx(FWY)xxD motif
MRKLATLAAVAALGVTSAVAANASTTGSGAATAGRAKPVRVSTRTLPKLGTVLVDGKGLTLYMFVPDKHRRVTCKGICAQVWPPLKLPRGAKPVAAGKAEQRLLGSVPDPAGGRVVTYSRWPLYTYVGDRKPGQATGQALNLNGGLWYVLSRSGKVIRRKP